jgi:hypothetical protein
MNRRLILAMLAAGALAYLLRDVIEQLVIEPLLYVLWVLKLYYDSLPQILLWILILAGVVLMAGMSLMTDDVVQGRREEQRKPVRGPVETLAEWMLRAPRGQYFKWLIAQRLGKLARGLASFNARQANPSAWEPLAGPGWDPPAPIESYLQAGLIGSFADYPRPRWPFQRSAPTPLDLDPDQVVEYIEAHMEKS